MGNQDIQKHPYIHRNVEGHTHAQGKMHDRSGQTRARPGIPELAPQSHIIQAAAWTVQARSLGNLLLHPRNWRSDPAPIIFKTRGDRESARAPIAHQKPASDTALLQVSLSVAKAPAGQCPVIHGVGSLPKTGVGTAQWSCHE